MRLTHTTEFMTRLDYRMSLTLKSPCKTLLKHLLMLGQSLDLLEERVID